MTRSIKPEIFAKTPKSPEYKRLQARIAVVRIALVLFTVLLALVVSALV